MEVAFELAFEGYGESGQEKESGRRTIAKRWENKCWLDEWWDPWEVKLAWQLWVGERWGRRVDESLFFSGSPATQKLCIYFWLSMLYIKKGKYVKHEVGNYFRILCSMNMAFCNCLIGDNPLSIFACLPLRHLKNMFRGITQ